MGLQTIDYPTAILMILLEVRYTRSRLHAHPQGVPFAAAFDALRDECLAAIQEDLQLQEAKTDAQATVDIANDALNGLCNRFSKAILTITGESREHGLYQHFFKGKDLTAFKRPKIGDKREKMGDWVGPSQSGEHPALLAMAPELVAALEAADDAVEAKTEALRQRAEFKDVGNRRKLVDHVNAVRKTTYGALASLAHSQTGLPANFADLFFRKDKSKPSAEESEEPETVEEAMARVEELREALAEAEAQHAAAVRDEEADALRVKLKSVVKSATETAESAFEAVSRAIEDLSRHVAACERVRLVRERLRELDAPFDEPEGYGFRPDQLVQNANARTWGGRAKTRGESVEVVLELHPGDFLA